MIEIPFKFEDYNQAWTETYSVDKRHLFWMYDFLINYDWKNTLEIGCLHGGSSIVFVELLKRNKIVNAHFCDPNITDSLLSVLSPVEKKVTIHNCRSVEILDKINYDFIWIDGDHSLNAVEEELAIISKNLPLALFAHDTSLELAKHKYGNGMDGPTKTKLMFQKMPGWYCLEDNAPRHEEKTDRGMFFATNSMDMYKNAQLAMEKWC